MEWFILQGQCLISVGGDAVLSLPPNPTSTIQDDWRIIVMTYVISVGCIKGMPNSPSHSNVGIIRREEIINQILIMVIYWFWLHDLFKQKSIHSKLPCMYSY